MKRLLRYIPLLIFSAAIILSSSLLRLTITYGDSMEPTYSSGDLLVVLRYLGPPSPGDVVMVEHDESFWIKRVAAVGGETINGITVPDGYVYILGDNPDCSYDSANPNVGPIPAENCWGKVIGLL